MPQNGVPQFVNFCRCTPCRQRRGKADSLPCRSCSASGCTPCRQRRGKDTRIHRFRTRRGCTPCRQRHFAQMLAHDAPHICCFPCRKNKKPCRTLRSGRFPAGLAPPRRKIRPARREKLRPVSLYQPRGAYAREPLNKSGYFCLHSGYQPLFGLVNAIWAQNSHYSFPFLLCFPKKGKLPLYQVVESFRPAIARTYRLAQANIAYSRFSFFFKPRYAVFFIAELTLNNSKCMFHLTERRGFAVLNISFPVNCIVRYMRQLSGTAVHAVVYAG